MKIEQQICSLDLAKRLKELGVKQESEFWWATDVRDGHSEITHYGMPLKPSDFFHPVSAFTVAELGELIPRKFQRPGGNTGDGTYNFFGKNEVIAANTEADARAKMLIYLLENKMVTL